MVFDIDVDMKIYFLINFNSVLKVTKQEIQLQRIHF